MKNSILLSSALVPIMLSGMAIPASAQVSAESDRSVASDVIVVTAQRREQSIQDVPISITALEGEGLQNRQIDGFDQLQYVVPGIVFRAGINARQSATSIKGIGTGLFNTGGYAQFLSFEALESWGGEIVLRF